MKAYYGSRFSPNMTRTPEGFLICHNVSIARTGWQEYLADELGLDDARGKTIKVYRSPEEVFAPATMASFEGKPATDEHPGQWVEPSNVASYLKGVVTNVRQGKGGESDLLLADLIIYDAVLISEIENGKREVSCGYDCIYEPMEDGKYQQKQIRGNHVAVVMNGRAGSRVAIKDQKPERRDQKTMMTPNKKTLFGQMLSVFAKDASPEEIAAATEMAADMCGKDAVPPVASAAPAQEPAKGLSGLEAKIDQLIAVISQLVQSDKQVHAQMAQPQDALDALEKELSGGKEEKKEESETIEDEAPVSDPEDRPKNPIPGADSNAAILQAIRAVKPAIAAIKDEKERKAVSDALALSLRQSMGTPTKAVKDTGGYASIMKAVQSNTKKAQDKDTQVIDERDLGRQWAEKYNPHYKKAQ